VAWWEDADRWALLDNRLYTQAASDDVALALDQLVVQEVIVP
jgi:hypothetical protein